MVRRRIGVGEWTTFSKETLPGTYSAISRDWSPGDVIDLSFPMPVRIVEAHACSRTPAVSRRSEVRFCIVEEAGNEGIDPGLSSSLPQNRSPLSACPIFSAESMY